MTIQSLLKEHQVIIIIIIIIIITISLHPYYNKFVGSLSGSRGLGGFSITVCVSEHLTVSVLLEFAVIVATVTVSNADSWSEQPVVAIVF